MPRLLLRSLAAMASLLLAAPVIAEPQAFESPALSEWARGPVSVLFLQQERATLATLKPQQAQAFIDWFWARRDPRPETTLNEFRAEFAERLAYVTKAFAEPDVGLRGWASARGRLYLLLGAPRSVGTLADRMAVDGAFRQVTVWEYPIPGRGYSVYFRLVPTRHGVRLLAPGGKLSPELLDHLETARADLVDTSFGSRFGEPRERSARPLQTRVTTRRAADGVLAIIAMPITSLLGEPAGDRIRYQFDLSAQAAGNGPRSQGLPLGALSIELTAQQFRNWSGLDLAIAIWMPPGPDSYELTEAPTGRTARIRAVASASAPARVAVAHLLAYVPLLGERGVAVAYVPTCPGDHPDAEAFIVEMTPASDRIEPLPGGRLALASADIGQR